ncbi:hypothetical protein M427DRAFT_326503 [Gonapodya prolifera JEL478]|uniref:Uncharacterized protein n=1 Tax=Gonapodya prolifera (strain JEL478) TaxID=1344416 RepID=A0A139AFN8_GONPJ|nr:hypothetical protein M427DRAFT_326503 [Gonapodya prolifera JEL478]|eukprot:KXS15235.1 hypothetical protein M427DRAFT_326503 [Gonapodya prolifera JEL478]
MPVGAKGKQFTARSSKGAREKLSKNPSDCRRIVTSIVGDYASDIVGKSRNSIICGQQGLWLPLLLLLLLLRLLSSSALVMSISLSIKVLRSSCSTF